MDRDLEAKARALSGLKGYVTNLQAPTAGFVMGAYHQLWQIEKSFRMSKTSPADLPPQTRLDRGPPHHRAPIRQGDPGYGRHIDGDDDGVGCED